MYADERELPDIGRIGIGFIIILRSNVGSFVKIGHDIDDAAVAYARRAAVGAYHAVAYGDIPVGALAPCLFCNAVT